MKGHRERLRATIRQPLTLPGCAGERRAGQAGEFRLMDSGKYVLEASQEEPEILIPFLDFHLEQVAGTCRLAGRAGNVVRLRSAHLFPSLSHRKRWKSSQIPAWLKLCVDIQFDRPDNRCTQKVRARDV